MAWFKVDDGLPMSRKVLRIPRRRRMAAMGLWALAGAWSARELTDGFIPESLPEELGATTKESADLVLAGLWDVSTDGWTYHDWSDYQPSRETVLADRKEHADRQKAYRDRKKAERSAAIAKRDSESDASRVTSRTDPRDEGVTTARPDPTRPDPTVVPTELPSTSSPAKRGTRIPEDYQPPADMLSKARQDFPSVDLRNETDAFRDWWRAKAGRDAVKLDWDLTWLNWMRKTHKENGQRFGGNRQQSDVRRFGMIG